MKAEDNMQDTPKRLIIGISGASGVTYGVRMLQLLRNAGVETHLVMSKTAELTFAYETDLKIAEVRELANVSHAIDDMAASISSGSFRTAGMVVAPCSMRSMSEIASGVTTTLLTRAPTSCSRSVDAQHSWCANPLHTGHLRTMTALSEMARSRRRCLRSVTAREPEEMVDHSRPRARLVRRRCGIVPLGEMMR